MSLMAVVAVAREAGRYGEPAARHRATVVLLEGAAVLAALELRLVLVALLGAVVAAAVTSTGLGVLLTWELQEEKEDFSSTVLETQEVLRLPMSTRSVEMRQRFSRV